MLLRVVAAACLMAAAAFAQLAPRVIERIEAAISTEMASQSIPALSVAVATDDELRWSAGYGMSDLENFVPAKASTVYRLASISKPITATALLQLVEQGRVDLDAPVQTYLPEFPRKPWNVTPRLLLSHLGGIRHYRGPDDFGSTQGYDSVRAALRIFQDDELAHEPGTRYLYTTYGFNVLGAIVESVAGEPFIDYLRERIFKPAGMTRIRDDSSAAIILHRARGYSKTKDGEVRNCGLADTSNKIPGGGLAGTAADLVKFAIALNRGKLLEKDTLSRMFTAARTRDGAVVPYGLGIVPGEWNGRRRISHGGGQQGTATLLHLYPENGVAIAVMCNLEGAKLAPLSEQIAEALVDKSAALGAVVLGAQPGF
jgi:CubicO group peptidase (beta-lactamase class C family)